MKTYFAIAVVAALMASTASATSISIGPQCQDKELHAWPTPMRGLAAFVGVDMHASGFAGLAKTKGCEEAKDLLQVTFGIGCDTNLATGSVRALLNPRSSSKRRRMFEFWKKETWEDAGKDIGDAFAKTPKDLDNLGKDIGVVGEQIGKGFDSAGKDIKDAFVGVGKDLEGLVTGVGAGLDAATQQAAKDVDAFFAQAGRDFEKAIADVALAHTLTAKDFEREFAKIGADFERAFNGLGHDFDKLAVHFKTAMDRFGRDFDRAIADILNGAGDINSDAMTSLLGRLTGTLRDVCPQSCATKGSRCHVGAIPPAPVPVRFCCHARTAECESCKADVSVAAFCKLNPGFAGCPTFTPVHAPPPPSKPTCTNSFRCPSNMQRKARRKCYDSIDDCECKSGFAMNKHGRCESTCKNAYVCPANSVRRHNRKCYDSIHDCQCNAGYTMNKHAERCEKIFVKPAPQPVQPSRPVRPVVVDTPSRPVQPVVVVNVKPTVDVRPVQPDPTDKPDAVATIPPPSKSNNTVPIIIGVVAVVVVLAGAAVAYRRMGQSNAGASAASPAAGLPVYDGNSFKVASEEEKVASIV